MAKKIEIKHGAVALIDVDGVLADFNGGLERILKRTYGLTPSDDLNLHAGRQTECYDDRDRGLVLSVMRQPGFCAGLPVIEGAHKAVGFFRDAGCSVVFLTAPMIDGPAWCSERIAWLESHFNASPKDIIFAHRKDLVNGDFFIDDFKLNIDAWQATHPDKPTFWINPYPGPYPSIKDVTSAFKRS